MADFPNIYVLLQLATGEVVAFIVGEVVGETLHVHIEKSLHQYSGSSEMINKSFVEYVLSKFPHIKYVNREDDAGDEGLRKSKLSYNPIMLLNKYNVVF